MLAYLFIFSLLSASLAQEEDEEKLVFLLTLFRHGARAPQKYYNQTSHLDYILEKWDNPGELTPMGKRMHYALGLQNRERYIETKKFLKETFDPHEILIYSTRFNRTLLSVASQLQGFYPLGTGEELAEKQVNYSIPPLDLSKNVKEKLKELGNASLPEKMTLAPIRMINDNERKIIIYDIEQCLWKRDEMRKINYQKSPELKGFIYNFSNNYNETLDNMYNSSINYNIDFVDNFCDAYIAGSTEFKPMEKINQAFPDESKREEILETCFEFMKLNFREWIAGDSERVLPTLEISKFMREFIHYTKQRIDADISGENITEKLEDYSRPKMLMISAHDSTISMWEMFFIKVFKNNNESEYIFPKFATQLAFEVVTNKTVESSSKKYEDYTINCYFNNDLFFSKNVKEFIDQVTPELYSDEKINEVCKFDQKENEPESESNNEDDDTDKKDLYFTLMIVFSATTGLFLILMIFFIIKATRSKSSESIDKEGLLLKNYE